MSEVLKEAFRLLSDKKLKVSTGKVTEIKGTICKVERENLPPLLDVRLQALEGNFKNYLIIKPKLKSEVVCLSIDGETSETSIVKYTEIESIDCEIEGLKFKVEKGKLQLKNDKADLKLLLTELLNELKSAVIQTPTGPGNFSPKNVQKFKELESKTKQLLS